MKVELVTPVTVTASTLAPPWSINCCVPTPMFAIVPGVTVATPGLLTAVPKVVAMGMSTFQPLYAPACVPEEYKAYPGTLPQVPVMET